MDRARGQEGRSTLHWFRKLASVVPITCAARAVENRQSWRLGDELGLMREDYLAADELNRFRREADHHPPAGSLVAAIRSFRPDGSTAYAGFLRRESEETFFNQMVNS